MTDPPAEETPEAVYAWYLDSEFRPLVQGASRQLIRAVLADVCGYLCHHLHDDVSGLPCPGTDERPPWAVCQAGNVMRAGFQIFSAVTRAVAGNYLAALGYDPLAAIADSGYAQNVITPDLSNASRARMASTIFDLAKHMHDAAEEADARLRLLAGTEFPDELWEESTGTILAMQLYRHNLVTVSGQVLFRLHALSTTTMPVHMSLPISAN